MEDYELNKKVKLGDRIVANNGHVYILASVGDNTINLINLSNGHRMASVGVEVVNYDEIGAIHMIHLLAAGSTDCKFLEDAMIEGQKIFKKTVKEYHAGQRIKVGGFEHVFVLISSKHMTLVDTKSYVAWSDTPMLAKVDFAKTTVNEDDLNQYFNPWNPVLEEV